MAFLHGHSQRGLRFPRCCLQSWVFMVRSCCPTCFEGTEEAPLPWLFSVVLQYSDTWNTRPSNGKKDQAVALGTGDQHPRPGTCWHNFSSMLESRTWVRLCSDSALAAPAAHDHPAACPAVTTLPWAWRGYTSVDARTSACFVMATWLQCERRGAWLYFQNRKMLPPDLFLRANTRLADRSAESHRRCDRLLGCQLLSTLRLALLSTLLGILPLIASLLTQAMLYPLNSSTRGPKSLGLKGKLLTICVPQKINNAREVQKKMIHYLVLALFLSTARAWHATSLRSLENTNMGARKKLL